MRGKAFCPAHITGFFKAEIGDKQMPENAGSLGAGFSIKDGVTSTVQILEKHGTQPPYRIMTEGFDVDNTKVSEFVIKQFMDLGDRNDKDYFFDVKHEISVPVGYGFGCSGAVALSLAYALDQALQTRLKREQIGRIAHIAEISCKTGLGDVLASYYGGFEIRTLPGAPGIGKVEKIEVDGLSVIMICFAPISTTDFLKNRLSEINGLGGKMVDRLKETKSWDQFQDMSLEFANYVKVMTPRMQAVVDDLQSNGIKCGIALFGETIFSLVSDNDNNNSSSNNNNLQKILDIVSKYKDAIIIDSKIDQEGARIIQ